MVKGMAMAAGIESDARDVLIARLRDALRDALDYIDAVPREAVDALPMPGFGRDEVEFLLVARPEDLADEAPSP